CRPSGPTGASTPATPNAQRRLHPGSSTTTISAATPHSEATPPPTGCHQRDGRVHLAPPHILFALVTDPATPAGALLAGAGLPRSGCRRWPPARRRPPPRPPAPPPPRPPT